MATPFDATTKTLVDFGPEDWLRFLGLPFTTCQVIDSDLATEGFMFDDQDSDDDEE